MQLVKNSGCNIVRAKMRLSGAEECFLKTMTCLICGFRATITPNTPSEIGLLVKKRIRLIHCDTSDVAYDRPKHNQLMSFVTRVQRNFK